MFISIVKKNPLIASSLDAHMRNQYKTVAESILRPPMSIHGHNWIPNSFQITDAASVLYRNKDFVFIHHQYVALMLHQLLELDAEYILCKLRIEGCPMNCRNCWRFDEL
jgi:preprotein translocase subunit SecA